MLPIILQKNVSGKIERAILKKKIQLVSMFVVGVVAGSVWFYNIQEVKVLFAERDKAEIIFENHFALKAEAEEMPVTIEEKIAAVFPENPKIMIAVAQAESQMNPLASHKNTNGSVDCGLFQINSVHGKDQLELFDVDKNIEAARLVYEKQGLGAWVAFSSGAYLKFVK
mgnify:CR=1 FL=1